MQSNNLFITPAAEKAIANLPQGFTERNFSHDFLLLIAMLHVYDFMIVRADEAQEYINPKDDLYYYAGSPSIEFRAKESTKLLSSYHEAIEKATSPDDKVISEISNRIMNVNLKEEQRMLALLEEFYTTHSTTLPHRLIIENNDLFGSRLRPQGSTTQPFLSKDQQRQRANEGQSEMVSFGQFLMQKYENDKTNG